MNDEAITVEGCASPIRYSVDLDDGRFLSINITHEGIIMDVYLRGFTPETDTLEGTVGMMFDEWADWLVQFNKECDVVWPEKAS